MSWIWALIIVAAVYVAANFIVRRIGTLSSSLTTESLLELISRKDAAFRILDVRTDEEYRVAHIPTAINVPHDSIAGHPPDAPADSVIVLYGRTPSQALAARRRLKRRGFSDVVSFGSIERWKGELVEGNVPGEVTRGPGRKGGEPGTSDQSPSPASTPFGNHGLNRR